MGDVVFVELPALGKRLSQGALRRVVESVEGRERESTRPASGEVLEINHALGGIRRHLSIKDPGGKGWFL